MKKNFGSNKTFELLTEEAEGEYFAYCDQDDVWFPEKLSVLRRELDRSHALLVCSDMLIIDEEGKLIADSITKVRRRHMFCSGEGLAEDLLISNFVTGCTMLIKAGQAKEAIPFCPYMVHDHYLALWCAEQGTVLSVKRPLICYRIHQGNQTGMMAGVYDKASYGRVRIDLLADRLVWLLKSFPCQPVLRAKIEKRLFWVKARQKNWLGHGDKRTVWRYRHFGLLISMFEIVAPNLPEWLFLLCIQIVRKNWV